MNKLILLLIVLLTGLSAQSNRARVTVWGESSYTWRMIDFSSKYALKNGGYDLSNGLINNGSNFGAVQASGVKLTAGVRWRFLSFPAVLQIEKRRRRIYNDLFSRSLPEEYQKDVSTRFSAGVQAGWPYFTTALYWNKVSESSLITEDKHSLLDFSADKPSAQFEAKAVLPLWKLRVDFLTRYAVSAERAFVFSRDSYMSTGAGLRLRLTWYTEATVVWRYDWQPGKRIQRSVLLFHFLYRFAPWWGLSAEYNGLLWQKGAFPQSSFSFGLAMMWRSKK